MHLAHRHEGEDRLRVDDTVLREEADRRAPASEAGELDLEQRRRLATGGSRFAMQAAGPLAGAPCRAAPAAWACHAGRPGATCSRVAVLGIGLAARGRGRDAQASSALEVGWGSCPGQL